MIATEGLTTEELQAGYRAARAEGRPNDYIAYYEAWFGRMVRAGKSPDRLRHDVGTPTERFWARTIEGLDGHLFWLGSTDGYGRPKFEQTLAQRFAWKQKHPGYLSVRVSVWATCGERNCMNADHLTADALARGERANTSSALLIERLQALAKRLGHSPTREQWDRAAAPGWHKAEGLAYRFGGTWAKALEAAGLELELTTRFTRRYETHALIDALRTLAIEVQRVPTTGDWRRSGRKPGTTALVRRFGGGWNGVLRAAGLR